MQSIRNNSLEPISISNWRWAYFLDETIKAFSTFQTRPYPIENDFDRFETVGPFSSRDECTAKAQEMNAAAYSCDPKTN